MSLIVAIKRDGVVYFGADTRTTRGDSFSSHLYPDDRKVVKVGSCFVAACGIVSNIRIMTSHPEWFELDGRPLTKKHIVTRIIPEYYELIKDRGHFDKGERNEGAPNSECCFLISDGDRLFKVFDDFEVAELNEIGFIGCTDSLARTVADLMGKDADPEEVILKCQRLSAMVDEGVGPPYVLVNTRDKNFKIVEV